MCTYHIATPTYFNDMQNVVYDVIAQQQISILHLCFYEWKYHTMSVFGLIINYFKPK